MKKYLTLALITFTFAAIGALVAWVLMNWMSNSLIIAAAILCGWVAFKKTKEVMNV